MPQPGINGMEPAFGEAYGGHRGLLSPYPLAMSPLGGKTEYDQSVLLMLGSPATPRKRPFELLSDLVDDGGLGEDLHTERWDVSALDEMSRYTKLGLGVGADLACAEEAVLMGRWGRSWEEEEEEERQKRSRAQTPIPPLLGRVPQDVPLLDAPRAEGLAVVTEARERGGGGTAGVGDGGVGGGHRVEVYQVAEQEVQEVDLAVRGGPTPASALQHCSKEHNYSLGQGDSPTPPPCTTQEQQEGEVQTQEAHGGEAHGGIELELRKEDEEEEEEDEEEDEEEEEQDEEGEEAAEETTVEAEASSSSETECEADVEPDRRLGEHPQKRRCFWEYRRARDPAAKKKPGGEVRWSLSWSSSTLPSTLYRREGKKGRRKARKTDASDLTPNPQKLHNIGEQLQKLNAAIDGMGPVNDLPAVARARSRKEKNKLASRACRLKKKAQHEANKIKLWGLNQEYDNLLGALLRIKEVIRQRVESSEEEDTDERGMTQRLEDILRESSGPLVAGRTKDFVQRILAASAGPQNSGKETPLGAEEAAG